MKNSRKSFLLWAAAFAGSLTAFRLFRSSRKEKETAVMLMEDGTLVEIDRSLLAKGGRKVSDQELKSWVKK